MIDIKTVTTQEELDEALAAGIIDLLIDRPDGATPLDIENKKVRLWGNSRAILRGNASAILWGNASADLWDNARAILRGNASAILWDNASADLRGNASADLWGNSRADLWDNSRADLWDNSSAILWDNARAILRGNSRAILWDNARAILRGTSRAALGAHARADLRGNSSADLRGDSSAILWDNARADLRDNSSAILKKFNVVWKKSVDATITGTGHVIDMSAVDLSNPDEWVEYVGANVDEDGQIHLYKAVDDNLESAYSKDKFAYTVGSIVEPEWWDDHNVCGNGIHLCPSPQHARDHFPDATRFLEVTCDAATFIPIGTSKIKTAQAYVLREVDICGTPLREDK